MKAEEGEGEGSEFSAVLESFFLFFLCVYRSTKRKQASANDVLARQRGKCVCEWYVCVCACA